MFSGFRSGITTPTLFDGRLIQPLRMQNKIGDSSIASNVTPLTLCWKISCCDGLVNVRDVRAPALLAYFLLEVFPTQSVKLVTLIPEIGFPTIGRGNNMAMISAFDCRSQVVNFLVEIGRGKYHLVNGHCKAAIWCFVLDTR
jgi:hypothetical protein